jgi:hypothetical protein
MEYQRLSDLHALRREESVHRAGVGLNGEAQVGHGGCERGPAHTATRLCSGKQRGKHLGRRSSNLEDGGVLFLKGLFLKGLFLKGLFLKGNRCQWSG